MLRRNNKKGFSLAELLIVVAIIAILVAIAVPVFVSALNKAEEATINANKRTVKGMAVTMILSDTTNHWLYEAEAGEDGKIDTNKFWHVYAQVDSKGDITLKNGALTEGTTTGIVVAQSDDSATWEAKSKKTATGYDIYVLIKATDLT